MELYIQTLTGTAFELRVSPFETIMSVKAKIQRLEGIPISHQHLIWHSVELEDDYCLQDYNIYSGATLKLVLAMKGGPINTRRIPVEDSALREMAEYMEANREELLEKLPSASNVTLLVYREGDKLNFFRVVDPHTDGTISPGSEAMYPVCNTQDEGDDEDDDDQPHNNEKLEENFKMKEKMDQLRVNMEKITLTKKKKKEKHPGNGSRLPSLTARSQSAHKSLNKNFCLPPVGILCPHLVPNCGAEAAASETFDPLAHIAAASAETPSLDLPGSSYVHNFGHDSAASEAETKGHNQSDCTGAEGSPTPTINSRLTNTEGSTTPTINSRLTNIESSATPAINSRLTNTDGSATPTIINSRLTNTEGLSTPAINSRLTNAEGLSTPAIYSRLTNTEGSSTPAINSRLTNTDASQVSTTTGLRRNVLGLNTLSEVSPHLSGSSKRWEGVSLLEKRALNNSSFVGLTEDKGKLPGKRKVSERWSSIYGVKSSSDEDKPPQTRKDFLLDSYLRPSTTRLKEFALESLSSSEARSMSGLLRQASIEKIGSSHIGSLANSANKSRLGNYYIPENGRLSTPDKMLSARHRLPPVKSKKKNKRCYLCGKKTGLATSYQCRCGSNFCASHRYAETHHCTFDYKTEGRKLLEQSNPLVTAPKLPKI
nr:AN1-type zinc finger protein 4-like [Biomphalaria glabrata]